MSAPRVLLGNLEPIVGLGMTAVLGESGIEVVGSEVRPEALRLTAGRLRPDAVVLDLGNPESRDLGRSVQGASPSTTVVLWARDEDVMEVLGPGGARPRRVPSPEPGELCGELARSRLGRAEG